VGLKVGCCGFPGGMGAYFREWEVVEVQQTFYKPPGAETARRWREMAAPEFEFTIKAWQLITHPATSPTYRRAGKLPGEPANYGFFHPTPEVWHAWETTREVARALGCRVILFQCPASFAPTPENRDSLRRFFAHLEREFTFAWEPRGSWSPEEIGRLCRELELVHAVDPFLNAPVWGEVVYFRLHGGPGYRHRYTDEELASLRDRVRGARGYVLFNNLTMVEDGQRFRQVLKAGQGLAAGL